MAGRGGRSCPGQGDDTEGSRQTERKHSDTDKVIEKVKTIRHRGTFESLNIRSLIYEEVLILFSSRSANPLGKLMDFLQEDVDSMQVILKLLPLSLMSLIHQRELDQWRKENRSLQLELRHEESLTAQVNCHCSLRVLLLTIRVKL